MNNLPCLFGMVLGLLQGSSTPPPSSKPSKPLTVSYAIYIFENPGGLEKVIMDMEAISNVPSTITSGKKVTVEIKEIKEDKATFEVRIGEKSKRIEVKPGETVAWFPGEKEMLGVRIKVKEIHP